MESVEKCERSVCKKAGTSGGKYHPGVMCDNRVSARMKGKEFKTMVKPAMLYGLENVAMRKRREAELDVATVKILRISL